MSFKLSELLNPAPSSTPAPHAASKQPSHSPPQRVSHSPSESSSSYTGASLSRTHSRHGGDSIYNSSLPYAHAQAQTVPSSYEAASALTALATSAPSGYATQYTPVPAPAQHFKSPTLPGISGLPPPTATAAAARRESFSSAGSTLPHPFTDLAAQAHAPSPANGIAQYSSYRASRSPDELRRQSVPTFDAVADARTSANQQAVGGDGMTAPIQLAPLQQRGDSGLLGGGAHSSTPASAPPHDQGAHAFLAASSSEPASVHHNFEKTIGTSHHPQHQHQPPSSPPSSSRTPHTTTATAATTTVTETADKMDGSTAEPAPSQIREPEVAAPEAKMTPQAPEPAERQPLDAAKERSPEAKIKDEPAGTPMEGTPVKDRRASAQVEGGNMDEDTLKAIEAAKNDFGLRTGRQKAQPSIEEPLPTTTPTAAVPAEGEPKSKKRPAPKIKKGQATVKKPPTKKRKVDDASSTTGRRSLSPGRAIKSSAQRATSGKKSTSNTPGLGSSPAPGSVVSQDDSAAYGSDAGSSSDDGNSNDVFCICRKGDNHTWMIACDGGCEDWFHGKCINILEDDGELIDKYICPNCEKTLGKVTTWLPGCRNRGCRRPARIRGRDMSKYCSDKCGREFMQGELKRSEMVRKKVGVKESPRSRRTKVIVDEADNSDDDLGPRGSALKASELKALVTSTSGDVTAFRGLGAGVLSPPATASPTAERFPTNLATPPADLNASEKTRLEAISAEKDDLRRRRTLLKDREKFGQMVRENVARYAEREKVKPKDVCGYDSRLTWGEEEFSLWREGEEGAAALESGTLPLPDPKDKVAETNGVDKMDVDEPSSATVVEEKKATMCTKKRCERHRQWQKQALADVRFEESTLADRMRGLEAEEREVRDAAALRGRLEAGGMGGEGIVEVVGA